MTNGNLLCAFDWHEAQSPWMTLNRYKFEFSRNFVWFRKSGRQQLRFNVLVCVSAVCHWFNKLLSIHLSTGCLQLLEISWNLYGPLGNFCVKCRWSTALVSSHDETGYRIAYLRNWSLFLSLPRPPCCAYHVFVLYLGKLVDSVHCVAGRSNANMSWIFLEIPPGISWKSPGNSFS